MLSEPTSLGKYGFLSIHPKNISLSDLKFENKQASIELNLTIQPVVTTYPPELKPNKLPLLSEHKKANGFDINLDIIASYDSLSSIISKEINGTNPSNTSFPSSITNGTIRTLFPSASFFSFGCLK